MEIIGRLTISVLENDTGGHELPLEETIVLNIQTHNPFGSIQITN